MDHALLGKNGGKPRILVAPLDWGLGHATRCIPIIRELQKQGADPWLAGEGAQEHLLREEFPGLSFLSLPGYRIRYARTARGIVWKMILQGPKMRRAILYEHRWLKKKAIEYGFDAVISDNRYGLYHKKLPCVFITHQLHIRSPWGPWTERVLQQKNYRYIDRFRECWVPDREEPPFLAGALSHPAKKPGPPLYYIGPLSRFEKKEGLTENKQGLLFILSGPEPQRSLLEDRIINEVAHYNGPAVVVRGLPGQASLIPSTNMIKFYNHVPADELGKLMQEAGFVICRSGYSSVMDAMILQKKCIFIPTPGQTEQEWLAGHLLQEGWAVSIPQNDFSLHQALDLARGFTYRFPDLPVENKLSMVIRNLLSSLH